MFVSYVLRVRPDGLPEGQFAGVVEAVATGRRHAVRSVDELLAFVLETAGDAAGRGQGPRAEPEVRR